MERSSSCWPDVEDRRPRIAFSCASEVVDGPVHGELVHLQALVQVLHVRVVLAGEVQGAVPLEEGGVVLADLRLDVRAREAGVRRHQVVHVGGIVDELLDHLGDRQLVGRLEALRGIGAGLLRESVSGLLDVRDVVALLEFLDVLLDAAEFALDDVQAVVDEQGGVAHRLVLVLHPFLVVDVQEGAEDGFGAGREDVLLGEHDDGGLLGRETGGKPGAVGLGAAGGIHPGNRDVMGPLVVIDGRIDDDLAHRGLHGVREMAAELVSLELLGADEEVADDIRAVLALADVEREAGGGDVLGGAHLDRGVLVQLADAEELVVDVRGLQAEARDHALHQVRRGEGLDLIVHIGAGRVPAGRTREGGEVAHHRVLGIFVHDDFFRAAVRLGGLVQIETRGHQGGQDADDIPPLVVPYDGPEVGKLQGLLLFGVALDVIHGKVVQIAFRHDAATWIWPGWRGR